MDIKGAEILAVGTWNRSTFTLDDLHGIVAAFKTLNDAGRIPLKLGHEADDTGQADQLRDGAPSLGWVNKLWVDGKKLMADFTDVPDKLVDIIKKGMYKFVSVELLRDVKAGTSQIPWVLDAVSILGATRPAVGILKDLQSLVLKRRTEVPFRAKVAMARGKFTFNEDHGMTEDEIKALIASSVKDGTAKLSKDFDDYKKDSETRIAAAQAETKKIQLTARRAAILGKFEVAIAAGTLLPKHRESFKKTSNLDKDDVVLNIDDAVVDEYIKENAVTPSAKKDGVTKSTFSADNEEPEMDVGKAMDARVCKLARDRNLDPNKIDVRVSLTTEVLKGDPAFAKVYNMGPHHKVKEVA